MTIVRFFPDGRRLLTCAADGSAHIWLVDTDDLVALASERITRDFTADERPLYSELRPER